MPSKRYPLGPSGSELELSWGLGWRNFTVSVDGDEIGRINGGLKALKTGRRFELPDGRTLSIHFHQAFANAELRVEVDGKPLPGSGADPEQRLKQNVIVFYFIGGISIALGLLSVLFEIDFLQRMGAGVFSMLVGALFAVLGYLVKAKRSRVALSIGVGLYALDSLATIVGGIAAGGAGIGGIVIRVFLFIGMVRGYAALRELDERDAAREKHEVFE